MVFVLNSACSNNPLGKLQHRCQCKAGTRCSLRLGLTPPKPPEPTASCPLAPSRARPSHRSRSPPSSSTVRGCFSSSQAAPLTAQQVLTAEDLRIAHVASADVKNSKHRRARSTRLPRSFGRIQNGYRSLGFLFVRFLPFFDLRLAALHFSPSPFGFDFAFKFRRYRFSPPSLSRSTSSTSQRFDKNFSIRRPPFFAYDAARCVAGIDVRRLFLLFLLTFAR